MLQRSFVALSPFVAGWGLLEQPKKGIRGEPSPILMQTQVPVIENEECKEDYKRIGKLLADVQFDNGVMCAGFREGGSSSCVGDSGKSEVRKSKSHSRRVRIRESRDFLPYFHRTNSFDSRIHAN